MYQHGLYLVVLNLNVAILEYSNEIKCKLEKNLDLSMVLNEHKSAYESWFEEYDNKSEIEFQSTPEK